MVEYSRYILATYISSSVGGIVATTRYFPYHCAIFQYPSPPQYQPPNPSYNVYLIYEVTFNQKKIKININSILTTFSELNKPFRSSQKNFFFTCFEQSGVEVMLTFCEIFTKSESYWHERVPIKPCPFVPVVLRCSSFS